MIKLDPILVRKYRRAAWRGRMSYTDIVEDLFVEHGIQITKSAVAMMVRGDTWAHIPLPGGHRKLLVQRVDRRMVTCEGCGWKFPSTVPTTRTCSNTCRQRVFYWEHRDEINRNRRAA